MKISFLRVFLYMAMFTVGIMFGASAADIKDTTSGELGNKLATTLYCDTKSLFQGSLGMAIGMLMVFGGIWSMARGGKIFGGFILIAFGGMFTALPSIVEATLEGLSNLLVASKMSTSATAYKAPVCQSTSSGATQDELNDMYPCRSTGSICE